ncbi:MAG: phage portal protein [Gallionella sp.]|nr:phage portal protein [Gallionella sp.]
MNATASWYNSERVSQPGSVVLKNWVSERELERKSATGNLYKELLVQASAKSGISVNWKTALQCSVALACGRVVANGIAQVPFKLFKERVGGGMDPAKDHGLYELLALKPNEWQTSFEFRQMLGLHLAFMNNAYVYKVRGLRGEVVELLPYEPNMVTPKRIGWDTEYLVQTIDGKQITVAKKDMWHLRGLSWDGVNGLPGIKLAREVIGLALAMEEHGARMFGNGAKPGGILTAPGKLDKDQTQLLRESWAEMQGGTSNAYKTAILSGGLVWTPLAQTGVDAQHLEQRRFQVEETCRSFGVLPIMIGHSDKATTYASSENMFIAHIVHTMHPYYESRRRSQHSYRFYLELELGPPHD